MKSQSEEQAAWDDFAEAYYEAEEHSQLPYVDDVLKFLKQAQLLPASVLDLGSGAGRFSLPFAQSGVQVTAVDFSAAMLAILKHRAEQKGLTTNLQIQQKSWQELVESRLLIPNIWLSMLPDITPQQMLTISQLASERLFIFRLTEVSDQLITPLLAELELPPERPEIQPQLMNDYRELLVPKFDQIQVQTFDYQVTEQLSQAELWDYFQTYPEMTPEKFIILKQKLQPELEQDQLNSLLLYRFELMILQR